MKGKHTDTRARVRTDASYALFYKDWNASSDFQLIKTSIADTDCCNFGYRIVREHRRTQRTPTCRTHTIILVSAGYQYQWPVISMFVSPTTVCLLFVCYCFFSPFSFLGYIYIYIPDSVALNINESNCNSFHVWIIRIYGTPCFLACATRGLQESQGKRPTTTMSLEMSFPNFSANSLWPVYNC